MEELGNNLNEIAGQLQDAATSLISIWLPIQFGAIAICIAIAIVVARVLRARVSVTSLTMGWPAYVRLALRAVADNLAPIFFIIFASLARIAMQNMTWPSRSYLLGVAVSLVTAWVVIALVTSIIRNHFVSRVVSVVAWSIAALSILGLLAQVTAGLDSVGMFVGGLRVTPLLLLKTTALLLAALWVSNAASNFLENSVQKTPDLTPSIKVLLGKLIRIGFLMLAIVFVLSSVGIDLSALAFFGGAVGVGVGFGLQKIVSNLVSGIILLLDKSIKPGDVISLGEQIGWIETMGARYTSVSTRDGKEILVPNEDFITQRVVNWTYSDNLVRLDVPFGVGYDSNPHEVRRIALQAVELEPRALKTPEPVCHFLAFGDSSLNFTLRFWIKDPLDGITNVRGSVLLALWDAFKRENIEIPFPQRDLNMRNPLQVVVNRTARDAQAPSKTATPEQF